MKITYLKTIGFRKFEQEFETELYNITTILGGNTKGKTNILYAIIWAFLGTNLTGDDKVWLGNNNSDNCYVELKFIDNFGNNHTLVRYKNKFDNQKNFVMLDDKKAEAEDIQAFYGDKKLFLSILNPNYFISKKPAEQKKMLDFYLPELNIKTVYDKLQDNEKKCLDGMPINITEYLQDLNNEKHIYEDKIKNIYGKIEYAQNIVNTVIEQNRIFDKDDELTLAMQELSFLMSDAKRSNKKEQQNIVDDLNRQIEQLELQIDNLTVEMSNGKQKYLSLKSQEVAHCPMCNQQINGKNRIDTINNIKKDLEELYSKKLNLEENLSNLKSKLIVEKCRLHSFDTVSDMQKEEQISNVQKQISSLELEKQEIEMYNNNILLKQKNVAAAKQDIINFKVEISKYEKLIESIKQSKQVADKLLINYIEEKMKFATQHLKNVKIKYYSILKDSGEIKEDFIITYNGNEFKNLSRSETIAASLELSNMFNEISKLHIPLFIDDSESCTDYDFIQDYSQNTQILIAKVEKGQDLYIKDTTLENDYLQVA